MSIVIKNNVDSLAVPLIFPRFDNTTKTTKTINVTKNGAIHTSALMHPCVGRIWLCAAASASAWISSKSLSGGCSNILLEIDYRILEKKTNEALVCFYDYLQTKCLVEKVCFRLHSKLLYGGIVETSELQNHFIFCDDHTDVMDALMMGAL